MTDTAAAARAFITTLDARDWDAWTLLLSPDVIYEVPQTRERIRGRDAYLEFNATFPGEWHLVPKIVIGDAEHAVVWFEWTVGGEAADAQVFFEFDSAGRITKVTDFWPEPYDPPERTVGLLERW